MGCFPLALLLLLPCVLGAVAQCPWGRDPQLTELRTACLCAANQAQQLSVQCSLVNFPMLTAALREYARDSAIDLVSLAIVL